MIKRYFLKIFFLVLCGTFFFYGKELTDFFQKPSSEIVFSPSVEGRLLHVASAKGQIISKGQLLFLLDDTACQKSLEKAERKKQNIHTAFEAIYQTFIEQKERVQKAEAQLSEAYNQCKASEEAFQNGLLSKDAIDVIYAEIEMLEKEIDILRQKSVIAEEHLGNIKEISGLLDYQKAEEDKKNALLCIEKTKIYAPISGRIQKMLVTPYMHIPPNAALCVIEENTGMI